MSGFDFIKILFDVKDIRIVYEAVIPRDVIIRIDIIRFGFELIIVSMILSLEKNPDVNGIAIRVILDNPMIDNVKGELFIFESIIRIS